MAPLYSIYKRFRIGGNKTIGKYKWIKMPHFIGLLLNYINI